MKLEFLDDITDGGKYPDADPDKLIRLFDFTSKDIGIAPAPDNKFVCRLSFEGYRIMIDYIKVFAEKGINGFNWLYDPPDRQIDLLFSQSGTW